MYLMKVDPRALEETPSHLRVCIKTIGICSRLSSRHRRRRQFVIDAGRRRVRLAIATDLEEIEVLSLSKA